MRDFQQTFASANDGSESGLDARLSRRIGVAVLAASLLYVAFNLSSGWFPHDEGQLGQCAERVLQGQLPHRDFDEMYTGGLTYLNAAAFRLFGVSCESMRWIAMPFFAAFVLAIYSIAKRCASPWLAAAFTFLCSTLTLPVYSAAMPSWYNLFFATYALYAFLRHLDSGRARWLLFAGLSAGCSMLFKSTGVFAVCAGLLYVVAYESATSQKERSPGGREGDDKQTRLAFSLITSFCVAVFALTGVACLREQDFASVLLVFTLPIGVLSALVIHGQWQHRSASFASRSWRLITRQSAFLSGVAIPTGLFVAFYAANGAMDSLLDGLFVLPKKRLEQAAMALPSTSTTLLVPIPFALVMASVFTRKSAQAIALLCGAIFIAGLLIFGSGISWAVFVLRSVIYILPFAVVAAAFLVLRRESAEFPPNETGNRNAKKTNTDDAAKRRLELLLIMAFAVLTSLIQFPYCHPIYFFYAAPLVLLLVLFVFARASKPHRPESQRLTQLEARRNGRPIPQFVATVALLLLIPFSIFWLNSGHPDANAFARQARPVEPLALTRCGFSIVANDAIAHQRAIKLIRQHAGESQYILAGPDSPQLYFLSQKRNPGREMYEFFQDDAPIYSEQLVELLDRLDIKVVAINLRPEFSQAVSQTQLDRLTAAFPHHQDVADDLSAGPRFRIFWR